MIQGAEVASTSPSGLNVRVVVRRHPYGHLLDAEAFAQLLWELGAHRAESIRAHHALDAAEAPRGVYPRDCLAMIVMDPTVGPWVDNVDAVMAAIVIGEGDYFLPNAAAKAGGHRRVGYDYGEAYITDPHLVAHGGFRHGHSARIRGVVVGASALNPDQDLYESAQLAAQFVARIGDLHDDWTQRAGFGEWLSEGDVPDAETRAMVRFAQRL